MAALMHSVKKFCLVKTSPDWLCINQSSLTRTQVNADADFIAKYDHTMGGQLRFDFMYKVVWGTVFLITRSFRSMTHRFQFWRTDVKPECHVDIHFQWSRRSRVSQKTKLRSKREEERRTGFFFSKMVVNDEWVLATWMLWLPPTVRAEMLWASVPSRNLKWGPQSPLVKISDGQTSKLGGDSQHSSSQHSLTTISVKKKMPFFFLLIFLCFFF